MALLKNPSIQYNMVKVKLKAISTRRKDKANGGDVKWDLHRLTSAYSPDAS